MTGSQLTLPQNLPLGKLELGAFFGMPEVMKFYDGRMKRHRKADNLIQGTGWENGKGCGIGCLFENYNHEHGARQWNLPTSHLLHLVDNIFEGLPKKQEQLFPERVIEAVVIGGNYETKYWLHRLMHRLLVGENFRFCTIQYVEEGSNSYKAIQTVAALHLKAQTQLVESTEWDAAATDASFAAVFAHAAARAAAYAARVARAAAAADAARAACAACAACATAARDEFWLAFSELFLECIAAVPTVDDVPLELAT